MMLGPFPRSRHRVDGGVAAATLYLSDALSSMPGIQFVGVRVAGARAAREAAENLGWPVLDLNFARLAVSSFFRRQELQLAAFVREYKPDLVHAQGADASGYLALRSGVPAIVTIHGILAECAKLQTSFAMRLREMVQAAITERYVVDRAADVIAISPYIALHYAGRLRGNLHDVPNAVSPKYFELRRTPEPGTVLYAGRIAKGKGLLDLVRAVSLSSTCVRRVVLAGSVPDPVFEAELRTAIRRTGLAERFELPGLLGETELLAEFSRAATLVLPSFQETAPMVIQQAMAAGLPVIATRVGGIPFQIAHEQTGLLHEPGDARELAALLDRIMLDGGLASSLSAAAREHALGRFSAPKIALATRIAYESALASQSPATRRNS